MESDEQKIRDLIAKWMRATAESDIHTLSQLMANDVVFLQPGQPPMRGRDAFAAAFKVAIQSYRVDAISEIQEIKIMGNWAYCWNHLLVTTTPVQEGLPMRRSGPVLTLFQKKTDGAWVLARDANMLTIDSSLKP